MSQKRITETKVCCVHQTLSVVCTQKVNNTILNMHDLRTRGLTISKLSYGALTDRIHRKYREKIADRHFVILVVECAGMYMLSFTAVQLDCWAA